MLRMFLQIECFSVAWKFHATKKGDPNNPLMRVRQGTESREHHANLSCEQPPVPQVQTTDKK